MADKELCGDILRAAAKLLAQEALRLRYDALGINAKDDISHTLFLNAGVRCLLLAERYDAKP